MSIPVLIAPIGALKFTREARYRDDVDVIEVAEGAPFPVINGKFLFAEEGSILGDVPSWLTLIEVGKGHPYPIVLREEGP